MTVGETFTGVGVGVSLLGVLFLYFNQKRANKISETAVDVETDDKIAARRLGEIQRLDALVKELRADMNAMKETIAELQKRDNEKQRTIDTQADELERTNEILSDVRRLFSEFVKRVEFAWEAGHETMPSLTREERELLEHTRPRPIAT